MKIIRKSVFETNSSSAHSLVISKNPVEINENDSKYDLSGKFFGSTSDLYFDIGCEDWRDNDEEREEKYKKKSKKDPYAIYEYYDGLTTQYEFNFNRGKPRVYDDFIHKTAFILAVNKYKDEEDLLNRFLDIVTDKAKKHLEQTQNDGYAKVLIEKFLEKDFRNKDFIENVLSSECSNYINLLSKILIDGDLIEKFIFDSRSYIALGGDEYEGSYLKLVGTTYEYYDKYGSKAYMDEFRKRMEEIYPSKDYLVQYDL